VGRNLEAPPLVVDNIMQNNAEKALPNIIKNDRRPLVPTIFHEDWWLEIASGGRYHVVEAKEGGRVVGRLPYYLQNFRGLKRIIEPTLTHFMGPVVLDAESGNSKNLLKRARILKSLLSQLPKTSFCRFKCHRDITDVIAFQSAGYTTTVQFTFEIRPQPVERVWLAMSSARRTIIRGAERVSEVVKLDDPQVFMDFYERNVRVRNEKNYLDRQRCQALVSACLQRGCGTIIATKTGQALTAAVFCAEDEKASYYLLTTRAPDSHSGCVSLLIYRAICEAMERNKIFDFDGIHNAGSAAFFSGFGGDISPRYIASRSTGFYRAAKFLFSPRSKENYFC
jgi:hypothetical protein